jgi:hypothetical protein
MSVYSQGPRPEFPELSIPESQQSHRRSPLRVIEPYVDFAADIECDIAKIAVGSADRARTSGNASAKKSARKPPALRSRTAGSGENTHPHSHPHSQYSGSHHHSGSKHSATPQQPRGRSRGPESAMRSPRAVKTAPESSRHKQPSDPNSQCQSQSQSHFSEDEGSDLSVRESLQSLKRSSVREQSHSLTLVFIHLVNA